MPTRVRIFIDFWNFQLSWNEFHTRRGSRQLVRIPWWPQLPNVLVRRIADDAVYAGTHVYASHNGGPTDHKLRRFFNVMDGFTGYDVILKERAPRSPSRCPNPGCHRPISTCPHCQLPIERTVEKGIDTALATDLIRFGLDGHYDRAILIAADADHIPAVEFLGNRAKQITHAWFRGQAMELRNACWEHIHLDDMMPDLLGWPAPHAERENRAA
jgi:uncharacterized LabA/DUF88 family protein